LFEKEYNIIKNYLPNKTNNIMDVGCGLGIINIFLQQHYKNNLKYFLIDKNKIDLKIKYGFQDNYESYNDLLETKKLIK
jgi:ubiquinone/menaquinone biosynthesis C-methylase UbiE